MTHLSRRGRLMLSCMALVAVVAFVLWIFAQ